MSERLRAERRRKRKFEKRKDQKLIGARKERLGARAKRRQRSERIAVDQAPMAQHSVFPQEENWSSGETESRATVQHTNRSRVRKVAVLNTLSEIRCSPHATRRRPAPVACAALRRIGFIQDSEATEKHSMLIATGKLLKRAA